MQRSWMRSCVLAPSLIGIWAIGGMLGTVGAQAFVVPAGRGVASDLTNREGNYSFHLPARFAPSRLLVVYRGRDLAIGPKGYRIGEIAFRRDGLKKTTYKQHKWQLRVTMSSDGVAMPGNIGDDSFDAAHGKDRSVVVNNQLVDWPSDVRPVNPPAAFIVRVKLDKPFVLAKGKNLCVDFESKSSSGKRETAYWYTDAERFFLSSFRGRSRFLGRGCPFGFQTRATVPPLDGESSIETVSLTRVATRSVALLAIGATNKSWGGKTLPLLLDGAPGCKIYTQPLAVVPALTVPGDARGLVRFRGAPLPRLAALEGLKFYEQVFVYDRTVNALGMRSSNYLAITLGQRSEPLAARLIYHSGPKVSDHPTGAVDAGIVLQIGH